MGEVLLEVAALGFIALVVTISIAMLTGDRGALRLGLTMTGAVTLYALVMMTGIHLWRSLQ
jgi:hypothetical protein